MNENLNDWHSKSRRIVLVVLLTVLTFPFLNGQIHHVRNISVDDGLSQSEVSDILEDNHGRILINSGAYGIDIFNGLEFERLTQEDGLISPFVGKLLKDEAGIIWMVSLNGLTEYRQDSLRQLPFGDNISQEINSIFCAKDIGGGVLLVGTDNGLIKIEGTDVVHIKDMGKSLKVLDIELTHLGAVMLATDLGLAQLKRQFIEPVEIQLLKDREDQMVYALQEHGDGNLYLGCKSGVAILNSDQAHFREFDMLETNAVISMLTSRDGRLLFGTNGSGLFILDRAGELTHLSEENGLSDDYIWTIYEDLNSTIWLGTSGAGADILSNDQFRFYSKREGLGGDIVYDIHEDREGRMWFGMVQGGITILENGSVKNYGVEQGLAHRTVRCFHQDNDTVWIGTENGLTIYYDDKFEDVSEKFSVVDHAIFDIHRDRNGNMWFACKGERYFGPNGGVVKWDGQSAINLRTEDGLLNDNVYCIFEKANELWFGTASGISIWNGEEFSELTSESNPCAGEVISMCEDSRGNQWLGSIGGLSLYRDGQFDCFTDRAGLKARTIYFIENQGDSVLWVGSAQGLEKLNLNHFYETGEISTKIYTDNTGFFGTECNQNAVCKDSKGRFWFGTIKAAVQYDPSRDRDKSSVKPVVISSVKLNGQETEWEKLGYRLSKETGLPVGLDLKNVQNNLLFDFIGIDPVDPKSIGYQFKLIGLEDSWSESVKERSVFFSNLQPGAYSFQVRAEKNASGVYSYTDPFDFEIVPAIWQEVWFKVTAILLAMTAMMLFFWTRVKEVERREKEKQHFQSQLHEVEMTALRAQMNPHFLFNSLNSVNHFIIKNKKEEASKYLTKFSRLVRIVLLNSKKKQVSLENELHALSLYIEMEMLRFEDKFTYFDEIAPELDTTQYQLPPLLLQPYVENAIWHGLLHLKDKEAILKVQVNKTAAGVHIVIEDNGVGRKRAQELKSKSALKQKSMGMKINSDRMRLAEVLYDAKTDLKIIDLEDEYGSALGTRVEISISYS